MSTAEMMTLGRKEIQETDDSLFRAQKLVANTIEVSCELPLPAAACAGGSIGH